MWILESVRNNVNNYNSPEGIQAVPGFVSFFSDVPGPHYEVLTQVGDDGVGTHHLRAEDIAEYTVIVVEVDG